MTQDVKYKICARCKKEKPLTPEFWYSNKAKGNRLCGLCKPCTNEYQKERRDKNPEDNKIRCKNWHNQHKDDPDLKKRIQKTKSEWVEANKEYVIQYNKEYRKRNNKHRVEYGLKYRHTHLEWSRRVQRDWKRNNPEKAKQAMHKRLARKRNLNEHFTAEQIKFKYDSQGGYCKYCGAPLYGKYHIDHIHPLIKNGTNLIDNINISCAPCNQSKGAKTLDEWRYFLE